MANFNDFTTTNKKMGLWPLVFSLVATLFGASATFGTIAYIFSDGSAFVWFLWISSLALLIQGFFFSKNLYLSQAVTIPHMVGLLISPRLQKPVAMLIATAWVAIIAAQLTAAATLLTAFFPAVSYQWLVAIFTIAVTTYTTLGGQWRIFKRDRLHLAIMVGGFLLLTVVIAQKANFNPNALFKGFKRGFNHEGFLILAWFFSKGLATIVGPDVYSRLASAKSATTAKKASIIASFVHFLVSCLVLLLALFLRNSALEGETFLQAMVRLTPSFLLIPVALAFLAAFASSCDSTLLSAATIIEHDLIAGHSTKRIKLLMVAIAVLAFIIALKNSPIMLLMINAYNIYSPVIVPMLLVALLSGGQSIKQPALTIIAFYLGLLLAIVGLIYPFNYSSLIIIVLTTVLSLGSYRCKSN